MHKKVGVFLIIGLLVFACKKPKENKAYKERRDKVEQQDSVIDETKIDSKEIDVHHSQPGKATDNESRITNNKGIGPIDEVELKAEIDEEMVENGEKLYNNHCASCHRIHESAMGPALGSVLQRRSPEFVMNMILNTDEMLEKDPVIKSLNAEYEEEMIQVDVTEEEAREIVEYLREYD